jgi:ribosomal protein S27AE
MNPLYLTVYYTVAGRRRRCPRCGQEQIVGRLDADGRYHCKACGHRFTKAELKPPARH